MWCSVDTRICLSQSLSSSQDVKQLYLIFLDYFVMHKVPS